MKNKNILSILLLTFGIFVSSEVFSQSKNYIVTKAVILEGDTVPFIELREFRILSKRSFKTEKEAKRFAKLIRDVKKAYPYAQVAAIKLNEYNEIISKTKKESDKKKLMKQAESELRSQFEEDIKNLTMTQGKILIKLIDRQTGNTSYEIIEQLRGSLQAFMWNTMSRIFGFNLKTEYDGQGDDKYIEEIVKMIENGVI